MRLDLHLVGGWVFKGFVNKIIRKIYKGRLPGQYIVFKTGTTPICFDDIPGPPLSIDYNCLTSDLISTTKSV